MLLQRDIRCVCHLLAYYYVDLCSTGNHSLGLNDCHELLRMFRVQSRVNSFEKVLKYAIDHRRYLSIFTRTLKTRKSSFQVFDTNFIAGSGQIYFARYVCVILFPWLELFVDMAGPKFYFDQWKSGPRFMK